MSSHPKHNTTHEPHANERDQFSASSKKIAVVSQNDHELELSALYTLASLPAALTVSLFLPTHHAGNQGQQDRIRLKNLLQQARHVIAIFVGKNNADTFLAPAAELLEAPGFWSHPREGLALFCRDGSVQYVWTPMTLPELIVTGQHCHLKPLMPLLQQDGKFYLLELTQHGVQLHVGTRFGLQPIALPGAPSSIEEALGTTDTEHHVGVRSMHGGAAGSAMYFGTGAEDDAKENIKHYFRRIDTCVCALLHGEHTPLVSAGVAYLLPLYSEVNHYPHLNKIGITGSPERSDIRDLHARAWDVVAPHYAGANDAARERFAQLAGTALTTTDLGDVLRAVYQGRVEHLFITGDAARWGTYDAFTEHMQEYDPRRDQDEDLLNTALLQALATRAKVQVLPQAQLPGGGQVAAVLRY